MMKIQKDAFEYYGVYTQMRKVQEEAAELIVAISHVLEGRAHYSSVMKEMVDVEVLLEPFKEWFEEGSWEGHKRLQLTRLRDRMKIDKMKQAEQNEAREAV